VFPVYEEKRRPKSNPVAKEGDETRPTKGAEQGVLLRKKALGSGTAVQGRHGESVVPTKGKKSRRRIYAKNNVVKRETTPESRWFWLS